MAGLVSLQAFAVAGRIVEHGWQSFALAGQVVHDREHTMAGVCWSLLEGEAGCE